MFLVRLQQVPEILMNTKSYFIPTTNNDTSCEPYKKVDSKKNQFDKSTKYDGFNLP